MANEGQIAREVGELRHDIRRLGTQRAEDGKWVVKYGVLFNETEQKYEALLGTLIAARKKGVIDFKGQMLLKGAHDNTDIVLLQEPDDS